MRLTPPCLFFTVVFLTFACQDSATKESVQVIDKDTAQTGVAETIEQPGQLSTDARQDTGSGKSTTGVSSGKDSKNLSGFQSNDGEFLKQQIAGSYDEIELAKLAGSKTSDKELKQIAGSLISDRSKVLDKLKKMATAKHLAVASVASDNARKAASSLNTKGRGEFDKAWCEIQIKNHKETISQFEAASRNISDAELGEFVKETLPKLRMHLDKLMIYHSKIRS